MQQWCRYWKRQFGCLGIYLIIILMFALLGPRRHPFVVALVTKSSQTLSSRSTRIIHNPMTPGRHRGWSSSPCLHMAAKSTLTRQRTLVVNGPASFSAKKDWDRPFKLVIVESPSKCQTIAKILQDYVKTHQLDHDYVVTSCMGHIRDLVKNTTEPDQKIPGIDLESGRYDPIYIILPEKKTLVSDLQKLAAKSQQLILATDDDREGEAMAWHLLQVLVDDATTNPATKPPTRKQQSTNQLPPLRVRFTEITPKAIVDSIFHHASTSLNDNLVQAQETRRILDRLAGFTISPVLWKKITPGLSAGRVQSVGMALVVQRERERLRFQASEYCDIEANFTTNQGTSFAATMIAVNGSTLVSGGADFDPRQANTLLENSKHKVHLTMEDARLLVQRFETESWIWSIVNITETERKLNPPAPFITSTLQQDANNRLGLSVFDVMRTAQQLYENGYISYMRTDSDHLSEDAKQAIKTEIEQNFGGIDSFQDTPKTRSSRKKETKKPEAQAAHEAIRPAIQPNECFAKPESLPSDFDRAAVELYELIYQRTVGSHMPPQVSKLTNVRIQGVSENGDTTVTFRTTGSVILKPGYTLVYQKQSDDESPILPKLQKGQDLACRDAAPCQHITQPPPRYTEASFVKELEALGVGRPSTYASTVQLLRDRAYVGSPVNSESALRKTAKPVSGPAISAQRAAGGEDFTGSRTARGPMVPSLSAFVVCSLLEKYCDMIIDPSFTAKMEERLDSIANAEEKVGDDERIAYLDEFYAGEEGLAAQVQRIDDLVDPDDARRANLPNLVFNSSELDDGSEIGLFIGPWGPHIKKMSRKNAGPLLQEGQQVTALLPPGMASDLSTITMKTLKGLLSMKEENGSILGQHPDDGRNIRLKVGRFGAFLQWGDDEEEGTTTHTLPAHIRKMKDIGVSDETTPQGLIGLSFQDAVRYVNLPRTVCYMDDQPIVASIGPYGPYLKYNNTYITLKANDGDVLTVDPATAERVVTEGLSKKSSAGVLAEIGEMEGSKVVVKAGRFGMYINWKKVNAKLPTEYMDNPSTLPLDEAWSLIQEKDKTTGLGKTKGKKKDTMVELPPGPKRPLSAYLHFCAAKRAEAKLTGSSIGDVAKELARMWSETSEEERQPFVALAEASKREYDEKKAQWTKQSQDILKKAGSSSSPRATKKISFSEEVTSIKKPTSSYLLFCSSRRAEVSTKFVRLGDISKELARLWSELTPEERKVYEEMASDDKKRYKEEIGAAESKSPPDPESKVVVTKKRGPSAYMLFCADNRNGIVDETGKKLPLGETTKRLAKMWKECDEEVRNKYVVQAEHEKRVAA